MDRAVVLVGGSGTGVRDITGGMPKALLKVVGKSVVERVIDGLLMCGLKDITLVSDQPSLFEDVTVKYGDVADIQVIKQVGSGVRDAILSAKDVLSKPTLLVYGDTLVPYEAYRMVVNAYLTYGKPVIMVVPEEDVRLYGAVSIDGEGRVVDFIEKPTTEIDGAYAYGGIAVYDKELIEVLEESSTVDEAFKRYIGRRVFKVAIWSGWWVDIGFPWDLLKATYYILSELRDVRISSKASIASTAVVKGPLIIEDDVEVDHYTVLKGPLYIGRNVTIEPHSLVDNYTSLEEGVYTEAYTEFFWSSIQPKVVIGHNSHIYLTVIGSEAVIEGNVITSADMRKNALINILSSRGVAAISKTLLNYLRRCSSISHKAKISAGSIIKINE
jgi:NDP-sugar pyrophosphorylase family protein